MPNWQLCIDESGQFDRTEDFVCVAGILIRTDNAPLVGVRNAIRRQLPNVPWPPHATYVRHLLSAVLWHCVARENPDVGWNYYDSGSNEALTCEHIGQLIRENFPDEWQAQCRLILENQDPVYQILGGWQHVLNGCLLESARHTLDEICRRNISALYNTLENLIQFSTVRIFISSEAWQGEAVILNQDRYLQLLETLLRRICETLTLTGDQHNVQLNILSRSVKIHWSDQASPLNNRHLGNIITRINRNWQLAQPNAVRFNIGVAQWNANTNGGLVLSDFIANGVRNPVNSNQSLYNVCDGLADRVPRDPLQSGAPPRPHLTAGPRVTEVLVRAQEGHISTRALSSNLRDLHAHIRRWAIDQALAWL